MNEDPLKEFGMHDGAVSSVFRNAAKLRSSMTEPEKVLWEYLKNKPLGYKFRRQHPIGGYVLDFYCHKLRMSIEVDGEYHMEKDQKEKDNKRTEYLRSVGIYEIRFTNDQVLQKHSEVFNELVNILREASPLGVGGERKKRINP